MRRGPACAWGPSGPALTAVPPLQLPLQWLCAVPTQLLLAAPAPVSPGVQLSLLGQKPIKGGFASIMQQCIIHVVQHAHSQPGKKAIQVVLLLVHQHLPKHFEMTICVMCIWAQAVCNTYELIPELCMCYTSIRAHIGVHACTEAAC